MFRSELTSPLVTIDPSFGLERDERGQRLSCGYMPRDWQDQPEGSIECCEPMPDHIYLPRSEWDEIIKEREANGATVKERSLKKGIKTISQNGTNHCWNYGTVRAGEIVDALQGDTFHPRSPTAGAALIKNYRNVGGNTFDAIPFMAKRGAPKVEFWPLNRLDRRYDTPETWESAADLTLKTWYELPRNNFEAAASLNLRFGVPIIIGVPWGRGAHMVVIVDIKALGNGRYGAEIWNSHGINYGSGGFSVLKESAATAFDQAAPLTTAA